MGDVAPAISMTSHQRAGVAVVVQGGETEAMAAQQQKVVGDAQQIPTYQQAPSNHGQEGLLPLRQINGSMGDAQAIQAAEQVAPIGGDDRRLAFVAR